MTDDAIYWKKQYTNLVSQVKTPQREEVVQITAALITAGHYSEDSPETVVDSAIKVYQHVLTKFRVDE